MNGDVASARLLLKRAAEGGNAQAALALGSTYDPLVIGRLAAVGVVPDAAKAQDWYRKAASLGSDVAAAQIAKLAHAEP
jgi:TPR repeat protein